VTKFGVLEYLDLSNVTSIEEKKKIRLEKEQYYLNNMNPSLNICKAVSSSLGLKRNTIFSINLFMGLFLSLTLKIIEYEFMITTINLLMF
jgi:DNA-binding XRE family transcriptional regulator